MLDKAGKVWYNRVTDGVHSLPDAHNVQAIERVRNAYGDCGTLTIDSGELGKTMRTIEHREYCPQMGTPDISGGEVGGSDMGKYHENAQNLKQNGDYHETYQRTERDRPE